ncbi:hypothetical protein F9U64_21830 [Gracilibacillus oryzae]|uniref:Uncharacterized protein n=1 Tax=Gracilibacillus oryzae TaxID=1672701 RepID=A0A7C8KVH3_9BACI|nr:hypothetical protein [Gracilibacillus oryzae]KAB8125740.1 hypothetical protein F9U64_21830 [Gracilibacillus oryzae]
MRIILNEIKKLFDWKVVALVLLLSFLFYQLFMDFEFSVFPNGRPTTDHYNIAKDMIAEYGQEMDETEFEDFKLTYQEEVEKANDYLQSREDAVAIGITTYEQFRARDGHDEQASKLSSNIMFEEGVDVFWELQARESIIERYANKKEDFSRSTAHINSEAWKQTIIDGKYHHSILPGLVTDNYNNLIKMVAIWVVISVMIIVGRVFIVDQKNNVMLLQYTSKTGRLIFRKKVIAAVITTLLITTAYLAAFFAMYRTNETSDFFQSKVWSFDNSYQSWFNLTFLQYIILTVIGIYLLALISGVLSTILSRYMSAYITLIGSQVPIVVILVYLIGEYLIYNIASIHDPKLLPFITYTILIAFAFFWLNYRIRREKRLDIL